MRLKGPYHIMKNYSKEKPNPYVAYELADIKIQLNDFLGALKHITFGIANSNDDIYRNYLILKPSIKFL